MSGNDPRGFVKVRRGLLCLELFAAVRELIGARQLLHHACADLRGHTPASGKSPETATHAVVAIDAPVEIAHHLVALVAEQWIGRGTKIDRSGIQNIAAGASEA